MQYPFVTRLVIPVAPDNIKERYDSAHNFVDILVIVSEMARWVPLLHAHSTTWQSINTLRPRRNGHHFADDIFKRIFFNENIWILIQISLKSVPKDPINNIPALVQIMAWRRPGDKPLSEPMMVRLLTHICVTRPQWINISSRYLSLRCNIHWHQAQPIQN